MGRLPVVLTVFALISACSSSASEPASSASSIPSATASATATTPSPSASITADACPPDALAVDCFASITADALKLRTGPSLDAPQVVEHMADAQEPFPIVIGRANDRDEVYIADGPTEADGLTWYQVGVLNTPGEQSSGPLYIGWVASGDGTDAWLVPADLCPARGPVELADLTYTALETEWAIHLGCFGDQVLTLEGWFPILPTDGSFDIPYDVDGSCFGEPAFLVCGPFNKDIRTAEMSFYDPRNTDRLNFTVDPASGVELPERGQWIQITGAFDHPAAQQCGSNAAEILSCRATFVVTEAHPL